MRCLSVRLSATTAVDRRQRGDVSMGLAVNFDKALSGFIAHS